MTADYPDFDSFWAKVQQTWDQQWRAVFGAEWEGEGVWNMAGAKSSHLPLKGLLNLPAVVCGLHLLLTFECCSPLRKPCFPVAGPAHLRVRYCVVQACQSCSRATPTPSTL